MARDRCITVGGDGACGEGGDSTCSATTSKKTLHTMMMVSFV